MALEKIVVRELPSGIINSEGTEARVPAGEYFVGDNGYLASENGPAWDAWVEKASAMSQEFTRPIAGALYNTHIVIGSNTAYGDGTFTDNRGNKYSVDSGMIGLTPLELLQEMAVDLNKFIALGAIVKFDAEATMSYKAGTIEVQGGTMHLVIPTGN